MKKIITTAVLVFGLNLINANLQGQSGITDYSIAHYLVSNPNGQPITTVYTFPKTSTALSCNQPRTPMPTFTQTNPRFYRWNDPDNAGMDCVFDKTLATTPLWTDPPLGNEYVAKMSAITRVGGVNGVTFISALSDASNPFVRGTIPPVVLNLRVTGQ